MPLCEDPLACLVRGFRGPRGRPDGECSVGDGRYESDTVNRRMNEVGTQSMVGCFLPEEVEGGKDNKRERERKRGEQCVQRSRSVDQDQRVSLHVQHERKLHTERHTQTQFRSISEPAQEEREKRG